MNDDFGSESDDMSDNMDIGRMSMEEQHQMDMAQVATGYGWNEGHRGGGGGHGGEGYGGEGYGYWEDYQPSYQDDVPQHDDVPQYDEFYNDIRSEQNIEYLESLRADQEKDRLAEIAVAEQKRLEDQLEQEPEPEPELTLQELRDARLKALDKNCGNYGLPCPRAEKIIIKKRKTPCLNNGQEKKSKSTIE